LEIGKNLILFGDRRALILFGDRRNLKYYLGVGEILILFGGRKNFTTFWRG
jgi:hypothetical protein